MRRGSQRSAAALVRHAAGLARSVAVAAVVLLVPACPTTQTVVVKLHGEEADALVTIDDQYVDKLTVLSRRGIKLPPGTYRITVEKVGYFPWDELVEVGESPLELRVELVRIPD